MGATPHFQLFGIPIRIEPFFWLATAFLGYQLGDARLILMWVAVVLVSVLVHEMGHALVLRLFGQRSSIVLHGFGGATVSQRRLGKLQSIAVSLSGPFAALFLLGIPAVLLRDSPTGQDLQFSYFTGGATFGLWPLLFFAAYVNIWWSIANLLPIRPLDGGHVMTELFGIRAARLVSVAVAAGAAVWAYNNTVDFQFAAFFFGFLAFVNLSEHTRARRGQAGPSAFDVDAPPVRGRDSGHPAAGGRSGSPGRRGGWPTGPPTAPPAGATGSRTGHRPPMAPAERPPGGPDGPSAESAIWNALRRGDATTARKILVRTAGTAGAVSAFAAASVDVAGGGSAASLVAAYLGQPSGPSNLVPATVLADHADLGGVIRTLLAAGPDGVEAATSIQTHLHYAERYAASAAVGALVHDVAGTARAQVAFDVACARSRAGDADAAVEWIGRAIDDGFAAPRLLDGEPDLALARTSPIWQVQRNRLGG